MAQGKRICVHLDAEAAALLDELAPSEHKKGAYLSALIKEAAGRRVAGDISLGASDTLATLILKLQDRLERLEDRLATSEQSQIRKEH